MNCPDGFFCLQFKDVLNILILIATIAAIIIGPLKAVEITKKGEERRESKRRRFIIFSTLMRTRQIGLDPEHVAALNSIQTEFHDDEKIITAYKNYIEILYKKFPDEKTPPDEAKRFFEEKEDKLFDLIHEIGHHLGYNLDRRELNKYSYAPQGWGNEQSQQQQLRLLLIQVLQGKRAFPIAQVQLGDLTETNNKFPPPPKIGEQ